MKKNTYLIFIGILVVILFIGCTSLEMSDSINDKIDTENKQQHNKDEDDQLNETGVFEGDKAKDFYLEDNSGNGIQLSQTFGSPIILNFWTSWSIESESVNTLLSQCYKVYKDKVQIISLNVTAVEGNNLEYVIKHIRTKGYEFPIFFDLEGNVAEKYWIRSFPTTYFIDKNGFVSKIYIGEINKEELFDEIKQIEE